MCNLRKMFVRDCVVICIEIIFEFNTLQLPAYSKHLSKLINIFSVKIKGFNISNTTNEFVVYTLFIHMFFS